MNVGDRRRQQRIEGQATFGMANLRRERTGLPFIVFIARRDDARVKVSPEPRVLKDAMGSYAVSPFAHKAGPRLNAQDEKRLETWIGLNADVLRDYWDGVIAYTEDAFDRLRRV
jgi:hypothetical protein